MKRSTGQGSSHSYNHNPRIYGFETFPCLRASISVIRTNFVCACALFGAFAVIKIYPARFSRIKTGRSTPFCHIFWRGKKDCDKFTNISNSVDTLGVC